jgi:hypothetical protein
MKNDRMRIKKSRIISFFFENIENQSQSVKRMFCDGLIQSRYGILSNGERLGLEPGAPFSETCALWLGARTLTVVYSRWADVAF